MTLYASVLAAGIIFAVIFIICRLKGPSTRVVLLKALVSFFFVLSLLAAAAADGDHFLFACFLGGGLLLGLLGDIWLDLRNLYSQDEDSWTLMGFGCFLAGHIFYIAAVVCLAGAEIRSLLIALIGAVLGAVFVLLGEKPLKLHYGSLKMISAVYSAVIFFMVVFTIVTAMTSRNRGLMIMGIGGISFLLSDLILSMIYFGQNKSKKSLTAANLILYYGGQYIIASSVLWAGTMF